MTLEKRIRLARTLTLIQLGLSALFCLVILCIAAIAIITSLHGVGPSGMPFGIGFVVVLLMAVVFVALLALPWIVLTALKKRQENWATAAYVSLILQIVMGGGLFAIFPIITLVLLFDSGARKYLGMK